MSPVFVVDTNKQPLDPVHPGRARLLLKAGKAAVLRRFPFTLVLKTAIAEPTTQPLRLKLDPGSKTTGIALLNDATGEVVFAAELTHRGAAIKAALDDRRAVRRSRRQRHSRYRPARFQNRRNTFRVRSQRDMTWLPPSLESRMANILTWVQRLRRIAPIGAISQELVTFDTQLLQNPDIEGVLYQQGELAGYEVRAFLLEKWQRRCAYCNAQNLPLQVEHIVARAKGGTNRISNLTLACNTCNKAKGTQKVETFLAQKPEVLQRILAQAKAPLKDAAAVNAARWALYHRLQTLGLPVEVGTGGRTKWNRTTRGLPKAHWLDAANVGASTPEVLLVDRVQILQIKAMGHGTRQMCRMDRFGFPRTGPKGAKKVRGFQTGDLVRAVVPTGKKAGTSIGRVAIRTSGSFNLTTNQTTVQGISYRFCTLLQHDDGYGYGVPQQHPPRKGRRASSPGVEAPGFPHVTF